MHPIDHTSTLIDLKKKLNNQLLCIDFKKEEVQEPDT